MPTETCSACLLNSRGGGGKAAHRVSSHHLQGSMLFPLHRSRHLQLQLQPSGCWDKPGALPESGSEGCAQGEARRHPALPGCHGWHAPAQVSACPGRASCLPLSAAMPCHAALPYPAMPPCRTLPCHPSVPCHASLPSCHPWQGCRTAAMSPLCWSLNPPSCPAPCRGAPAFRSRGCSQGTAGTSLSGKGLAWGQHQDYPPSLFA